MKNDKFPIAILISGRGSNLAALHEKIQMNELRAEICCVVSSSSTAKGLDYARAHGLPAFALDADTLRDETAMADKLLEIFAAAGARLIVLAGFLKRIPVRVIRAYPNSIINVHPALLPAFGGKGMYGKHVHRAVLDYGCRVSGATVHLVSSEYDAGPPILQACVPVLEDDTPESLAARILPLEHRLLPEAVQLFSKNLIIVQGRKVVIKR